MPATTAAKLVECATTGAKLTDIFMQEGHDVVPEAMLVLQELWDSAYAAGRGDEDEWQPHTFTENIVQ